MINDSNGAKLATPVIDPAEYDFSDVPDDQLECCLYYEYLRESEAFVREVRKVRSQFLEEAKRRNFKPGEKVELTVKATKVTKHEGFMFEGSLVVILAVLSDFPDVPWQKISTATKRRLKDFPARANEFHCKNFAKEHPILTIGTVSKEPWLGKSTLNDWKVKRTPKNYQKIPAATREKILVPGFIQIHFGYTPEQLLKAFGDWLKANHPQPAVKPGERRGRDTDRDPLNALAALRLRYHCRTLNEAQKLIALLAPKPNAMHYSDRTAFNRACDRAVERFHWLLKLPDGQLPRRFTKGWQKNKFISDTSKS